MAIDEEHLVERSAIAAGHDVPDTFGDGTSFDMDAVFADDAKVAAPNLPSPSTVEAPRIVETAEKRGKSRSYRSIVLAIGGLLVVAGGAGAFLTKGNSNSSMPNAEGHAATDSPYDDEDFISFEGLSDEEIQAHMDAFFDEGEEDHAIPDSPENSNSAEFDLTKIDGVVDAYNNYLNVINELIGAHDFNNGDISSLRKSVLARITSTPESPTPEAFAEAESIVNLAVGLAQVGAQPEFFIAANDETVMGATGEIRNRVPVGARIKKADGKVATRLIPINGISIGKDGFPTSLFVQALDMEFVIASSAV